MDKGDKGALVALGMLLGAVVIVAALEIGSRYPANTPIGQQNAANVEQGQGEYVTQSVSGADNFDPWRDTYAQWLMALLTIAATGVSIWAVRLVRDTLAETRKSTAAAVRAAEAAQEANVIGRDAVIADNRPWLSLQLSIASSFDFTGTEGRITIHFEIRNYGNMPATGVDIKGDILASGEGMIAKHAEITDSIRRRPATSRGGFTIFPGNDVFTCSISLPLPMAEIQAFNDSFGPPSQTIYAAPVLIAAVGYRSSRERPVHVTSAIMHITRVVPDRPHTQLMYEIVEGVIPMQELRLERGFGYEDAD